MLNKYLQEILYRVDTWINEVSGWGIESIEVKYVKISAYILLSGSSYIKFRNKLRNSMFEQY